MIAIMRQRFHVDENLHTIQQAGWQELRSFKDHKMFLLEWRICNFLQQKLFLRLRENVHCKLYSFGCNYTGAVQGQPYIGQYRIV